MSRPGLTDIPPIGLGTWKNSDPETCRKSVCEAIEIGYRHIDTAQLYENEESVGEGIDKASVDREQLFVATKVDFNNMAPSDVINSTEESLRKLGLDRIDLLYVHWPAGEYDHEETLGAFLELQDENKIQHVGLSNFTPQLLADAREVLNGNLYAHQVEMHPFLQQEELRQDAVENDIYLVAYSPFRHGTIFDREPISSISDETGSTPAQVILAWLISKPNVVTIPKASSSDHLRDNFNALNVSLDDKYLEQIDSIQEEDRYIDPSFAPEW